MRGSEIFAGELSLILNNVLRNEVAWFLDSHVPQYFFEVAASSTGKYHPWYSLGWGGLVRHTKAAVQIADDLLSLEQYAHLDSDIIIAALILHDSFKHGETDSGHTQHNHPEIAKNKLLEFAPTTTNPAVFECIADLVWSHMGEWNINRYSTCVLPKPETEAQKLVHLCDYLASRKYITVEVQ